MRIVLDINVFENKSFLSGFMQILVCEVLVSDRDSWELPNSVGNNTSICGSRGSADFLKQPYSPANHLMRKKLMGSDLSLESLFASAKKERKKKRLSFNDQFVIISSSLQNQINICTFTVSLPWRREIF